MTCTVNYLWDGGARPYFRGCPGLASHVTRGWGYTRISTCRRGSRIFERGGGSRRGYRIFHKRDPPSENLKNTPTLGHSQAPPRWTLPVWRHPHSKGGQGDHPCHTHTHPGSATGVHLRSTSKKGGGPTLGPMLKSLHRGPKGAQTCRWRIQGGSRGSGPPPGSATDMCDSSDVGFGLGGHAAPAWTFETTLRG